MVDMSDLPQPNEGFRWVQADGLPALVCDPLLEIAGHLFTTRAWPLGTTVTRDDQGWDRVARALGVESNRLGRVKQVHGAAVVDAEEALGARLEADAVVSNLPTAAVAIQTADCVPILMADPRTGAVAAVHAGWRGLAARTPEAAVAALGRAFGTEPSDIVAAIGPAIGACCYKVGEDVFKDARFPDERRTRWFTARAQRSERNPAAAGVQTGGRQGHWFFDGNLAARDQLEKAGVSALRIFAAGLCTASHPSAFCSYRRDGRAAGRMAAAIRSGPRP
jgi:hypothetical protein